MTEEEFLTKIEKHISDAGYTFNKRLLAAFHTSLKINDISCLTVNAGISGTGKSQLPKLYADAAGMYFLMVSVKPGWDSPQDLFGYYNYVEKSFKPTELLQALVEFDKYQPDKKGGGLKDNILMVLLDEMNIARVEYYFSDVLSKLEMRRNINKADESERASVNIEFDIGRLQKNESNPKVFIDSNVLFVGTMNEDESTHSLSDKLIDRANVIRFGAPKTLKDAISKAPPAKEVNKLPDGTWKTWFKDVKVNERDKDVEEKIEKLNDALGLIGKPFGHRVYQAILAYIANYPYDFVGGRDNNKFTPLVDQVMMRGLPRLDGMDTNESGTEDCINKIKELLPTDDSLNLKAVLNEAQKRPYFSWKGIDYAGVKSKSQ